MRRAEWREAVRVRRDLPRLILEVLWHCSVVTQRPAQHNPPARSPKRPPFASLSGALVGHLQVPRPAVAVEVDSLHSEHLEDVGARGGARGGFIAGDYDLMGRVGDG